MGTLFNQPPRELKGTSHEDLQSFLGMIKQISSKTSLSVENVLEAYRVKELERQNDLYVHNGNILDEQLSGFGELIKELTHAIESK